MPRTAVEAELGAIDVWVNDAFTSVFARFIDIEPEEFRRVTEVSYLGFVNGTRTALSRMLPRDSGVIVQVGSALAHRGIPLQSAYCGAEHAMWGFHESLLTQICHDHSNVRVTNGGRCPASTPHSSPGCCPNCPTQAQPVPPFYQPEVAARGGRSMRPTHPRTPCFTGSEIATARTIIAQPRRRRAAGPLPGAHRGGLPADPRHQTRGPGGQPVAARRRIPAVTTTARTVPSMTAPSATHPSSGPPSTAAPWAWPLSGSLVARPCARGGRP